MSEQIELDELLNGYVDGELSDRQTTEVRRMMLHDRKIAARVEELMRQRQLLASLPAEAAPAGLVDSIRGVMERRSLLIAASSSSHRTAGLMHLFARKLVAAAAMLALLGGLAFLVYTVIIPNDTVGPSGITALVSEGSLPGRSAPVDDSPVVPKTVSIELLLKTVSPSGLNSVIAKTIDADGLWDCATVDRQLSKTTYSISCSKENIGGVLDELSAVWDKIAEKRLVVEATGEDAITVEAVTPKQVAAVIDLPDIPSRVASARQFAEANNRLPVAGDADSVPADDAQSVLKIPKPALTSPDFDRAARSSVESRTDKVSLKITVLGIE